MSVETTKTACPKNPDHGEVTQRRLLPQDRQMIDEDPAAIVFEIQCPECGTYEYRDS